MLVAFSSPVKLFKSDFSSFSTLKFRAKLEVVQQKQFLSVAANHSKGDFSTVKWVTDSEETRQLYSTEIPSEYKNDPRGKLDSNWLFFYLKLYRERHTGLRAITAPAYKQPSKLSQLKKNSIKFTHSDFPCHLKVNWDKLCLD